MLLGLRTVVYQVPELASARAWFADLLGLEPYFDEPFYVGFNVGGYELGLLPDADDTGGARPEAGQSYWGVADIDAALTAVLQAGAEVVSPDRDVGGGIRLAVVREPSGNLLGLIENPHFSA